MSLAATTREAVEEHPFLVDALRARICNYTAAARFLDVGGDVDAVATALRRYAEDLPPFDTSTQQVRVTMESGIEPVNDPADALVQVGETGLGSGRGDRTAIVATGDVDAAGVVNAMERCLVADVDVATAAFVAKTAAIFVVSRRDGANALRLVEESFEEVPMVY